MKTLKFPDKIYYSNFSVAKYNNKTYLKLKIPQEIIKNLILLSKEIKEENLNINNLIFLLSFIYDGTLKSEKENHFCNISYELLRRFDNKNYIKNIYFLQRHNFIIIKESFHTNDLSQSFLNQTRQFYFINFDKFDQYNSYYDITDTESIKKIIKINKLGLREKNKNVSPAIKFPDINEAHKKCYQIYGKKEFDLENSLLEKNITKEYFDEKKTDLQRKEKIVHESIDKIQSGNIYHKKCSVGHRTHTPFTNLPKELRNMLIDSKCKYKKFENLVEIDIKSSQLAIASHSLYPRILENLPHLKEEILNEKSLFDNIVNSKHSKTGIYSFLRDKIRIILKDNNITTEQIKKAVFYWFFTKNNDFNKNQKYLESIRQVFKKYFSFLYNEIYYLKGTDYKSFSYTLQRNESRILELIKTRLKELNINFFTVYDSIYVNSFVSPQVKKIVDDILYEQGIKTRTKHKNNIKYINKELIKQYTQNINKLNNKYIKYIYILKQLKRTNGYYIPKYCFREWEMDELFLNSC